jgi:nicotinamide phosphoribosyltransferase
MKKNLILTDTRLLHTDSYKFSHFMQYPPKTMQVNSYIESRGGAVESVFFGLQAFIKEYLLTPITKEEVDEAEDITALHGVPFNREGWNAILRNFGGYLPLEIEAVREGTVMPTSNVQVQIRNTHSDFFWLPGILETALLRAVWYPSTVATKSREMKKIILRGLRETSDSPTIETDIQFKLHDFGARGATSSESAMLGGMGHLVNFMGTDTIEAVLAARKFYNEKIAGFSIPAAEHSTITSWGRENEVKAFENMIDKFAGPGKIYAVVSDSYDIYNAVDNLWGTTLRDKVIAAGGALVVRPDSGNAEIVPVEVIERLADKFGFEVNSKGYKVLHPSVRVIQGDGITEHSLPKILENLKAKGFSADNIVFGMGGGLLQAWDRDTLKYAMKASSIDIDGIVSDVYKDPIHGGKKSKMGRLALIDTKDGIKTIRHDNLIETDENILEVVFRNGELLVDQNLSEIRERAALGVE